MKRPSAYIWRGAPFRRSTAPSGHPFRTVREGERERIGACWCCCCPDSVLLCPPPPPFPTSPPLYSLLLNQKNPIWNFEWMHDLPLHFLVHWMIIRFIKIWKYSTRRRKLNAARTFLLLFIYFEYLFSTNSLLANYQVYPSRFNINIIYYYYCYELNECLFNSEICLTFSLHTIQLFPFLYDWIDIIKMQKIDQRSRFSLSSFSPEKKKTNWQQTKYRKI